MGRAQVIGCSLVYPVDMQAPHLFRRAAQAAAKATSEMLAPVVATSRPTSAPRKASETKPEPTAQRRRASVVEGLIRGPQDFPFPSVPRTLAHPVRNRFSDRGGSDCCRATSTSGAPSSVLLHGSLQEPF